jgi:hypothetical protein
MELCEECGAAREDGARFCWSCGGGFAPAAFAVPASGADPAGAPAVAPASVGSIAAAPRGPVPPPARPTSPRSRPSRSPTPATAPSKTQPTPASPLTPPPPRTPPRPTNLQPGNTAPGGPSIRPTRSPPTGRSRVRRPLLVFAILVVALIAAGVAGQALTHRHAAPVAGNAPTDPSSGSPSTATPPTTDPTTTSGTSTERQPARESAMQQLEGIAARDSSRVNSLVGKAWVPIVSSKHVGTKDPLDAVFPGRAYDEEMIVEDFRWWLAHYPGALLFRSSDFHSQEPGYWVTIVDRPTSNPENVISWCRQQGLDPDNCDATLLSHSLPAGPQTYRGW